MSPPALIPMARDRLRVRKIQEIPKCFILIENNPDHKENSSNISQGKGNILQVVLGMSQKGRRDGKQQYGQIFLHHNLKRKRPARLSPKS